MSSIPQVASNMMSFPSNFIITKPLFSYACPSNLTQPCKTNSPLLRSRLAGRHISRIEKEKNQIELPVGLEPELMPKHVAVIMDGNRRWARDKGLPVFLGHRAGGKAFLKLLRNCVKYGVKVLTVFAFSTENWTRPQGEVNFLIDFFEEFIEMEMKKLAQDEVRLTFVGTRSQLPLPLQKHMSDAEALTKDNTRIHLVVAVNYGGRYDITEAAKKIAAKVKHGILQVDDINDTVLGQHLETNGVEFPDPDLLIRSSGECRVSNFMLWQLAYAEFFFTSKLFPEFGDADLLEAITAFQMRRRRFGGP